MSRRDAREVAFKLIFEFSFSKMQKNEVLEEYVSSLSDDDKAYVSEVYYGVIAHFDELVEHISANAQNFSVDRIFKVDFALLLLAIYEIKFMEGIPFKVSVDEALNLASKYSSEKSVNYINGVLSKFAR